MNGALRAVAFVLLASLLLTVAVASLLANRSLFNRFGSGEVPVAAILVFFCFIVPGTAVLLWIQRKGRDAQQLAEYARKSFASEGKHPIPQRGAGGIGDLAKILDEWRRLILDRNQKVAEQQLILERILGEVGEGILAVDRRKNIVLANAILLDLFGLKEPVGGVPFYALIRNASVQAAFDRALEGNPGSELITIRTGSGERRAEFRIVPVSGETDIAAVAIFVDVTRLLQLEKVRRDFLTDFSHEVRTPLAGLRSSIETLGRGGLSPADESHLQTIAARQILRLERLVEDLSEINRIETGDLQLEIRPGSLGPLLEDVADEFRERAKAKEIRIEVEYVELSEIPVDARRIQQVVANLLDNAIKYSPPGGRVRLLLGQRDGAQFIEVVDEGEGIDAEEQARIFNRLYRVDKSRSQEVPGTGVGLSIASHLVKLHQGLIEVQSAPGRGATFRVVLPLSRNRNRGR